METINWPEEERDRNTEGHHLVSWLLLAAMTAESLNQGDKPDLGIFTREDQEKFDSRDLHVQLLVNDIEVPFVETLQRLYKEWDRQVGNAAKALVKERLGTFEETVSDLTKTIKLAALEKLGVELSENERWELTY